MVPETYPFIDIVVLEPIRRRFARGDALIVLSSDVDSVVWIDGAAAALFGFSGIEDVHADGAGLPVQTRRQLGSLRGLAVGQSRPVTVRVTSGLKSRIVTFEARAIRLPGGETALLLALAAPDETADDKSRAAAAISGLGDEATDAAIVDAEGTVLAASAGYAAAGIETAALREVLTAARSEPSRTVKRRIAAAHGPVPAGVARLDDDPARFLLFIISGEAAASLPEESAVSPGTTAMPVEPPEPDAAVTNATGETASSDDEKSRPPSERDILKPWEPGETHGWADRWYFHGDAEEPHAKETGRPAPIAEKTLRGDGASGASDARDGADAGARATAADDAASEDAIASEAAAAPPEPAEPAAEVEDAFRHDPSSGPARFVWRIDADGRFTEVSSEFAEAVGPRAADVVGRRFGEVAETLGLDPEGAIAPLLERRDTWSGRSVLWPIEGTALRAPVDLAALPAYSRERQFIGFRGFGVVRPGEAVDDPDAAGIALARPATPPADEATPSVIEGADSATAPVEADEEKPAHVQGAVEAAEPEKPAEAGEAPEPAMPAPSNVEEQSETVAGRADEHLEETVSQAPEAEQPTERDPFRGERPVIYFAETPFRRASDKVVRLEHRRRNGELSASERNAFQEIADRLRREGIIAGVAGEEKPEAPAGDDGNEPTTAEETSMPDVTGAHVEMTSATGAPEPANDTVSRDDASSDEETQTAEEETSSATSPDAATQLSALEDADETTEPEAASNEEAAKGEPEEETIRLPVETAEAVPEPRGPATAETEAKGAAEAETPLPPPARWLPSAFATGARSRAKSGAETSILASLPVPVVIHSGDVIHYVNRAFLDLTGYESAGDLARAGGLDGLLSAEKDAEGADGTCLTLACRDGSQRRVKAHLQAVPWEEARALMLAVLPEAPVETPAPVAVAEAGATAAQVEELTAILDTATDGVVILDEGGQIRSLNHSAAALFGYDPADVVGKPFSMLFAIESQRAAMDYLGGLSGSGVASLFNDGREVIGREAQGGFIPLFMTIGKLAASNGYCAVLRDITQWKRTEEELVSARREAERTSSQKSEFLARISHEIRTPLNAIIGFAELMSDEKFGPIGNQRYKDYLRDIARSGNHVLDIVNDLLDLTKIEAGALEMKFEAVPLNDALAEMVAIMQPQANRERVIIRSSLPSDLPDVVADLRSIKQIVLNLLSNAVRFTGPGGQVIVSTSYEPTGEIVMRVRDTGIGMSQAEIDEALKPFRQVNPLRRGRGDGTGLGLPLTKAMVEANRAVFAIESSPGGGTMVEVTFPPTRVLAD